MLYSGSRSSLLNFEARSIDTRLPARKCVILMINEFSSSRFRELLSEGVAALLIIIPSDFDSVTEDLKEASFLFLNHVLLLSVLFFLAPD